MLLHTSLLRSERPRRDSPSRHPIPTGFTTLVHSLMATDDLPGDVSEDSWDTGHPALPMDGSPQGRGHFRNTRGTSSPGPTSPATTLITSR
jgi:hypothetical protein